jgi:ATP-dependent helicase/nuclease subunit A
MIPSPITPIPTHQPALPTSDIVVPEGTRLAQQNAAHPQSSVWVSANAGSGKTRVLTDRVLRLLLQGVPAGKILCLTYTKAAAANMSIRIFEALADWVTKDDNTLSKTLQILEGKHPSTAHLKRARRLFAHAVETPGGLKIETIHAFCQRILKQFPFEANVPAHFRVLEESEQKTLFAEAFSHVISRSFSNESEDFPNPLRKALQHLTPHLGDDKLLKALQEACAHTRTTSDWQSDINTLRTAWNLPTQNADTIIQNEMQDQAIPATQWPSLIELLNRGSKNDQDQAKRLQAALNNTGESRFETYKEVFFTKEMNPRKRLVTDKIAKDYPHVAQDLEDEKERLLALLDKLRQAQIVERTRALCTLALAVQKHLTARKQALAALDFDDLLTCTANLFSRVDAAWVMYKLDAGIDHLLVDEAQDTNPEMWRILSHLVEEFSAGEGMRNPHADPRTVFAVGDPKQSIYSFQGAAPHEFERSGQRFKQRLSTTSTFEQVELRLSFRSAPAVLKAVDAVFSVPENTRGLSVEIPPLPPVHESARPSAYGVVEVWPLLRPDPKATPDPWEFPVDEPESGSPPVRNAKRIAAYIQNLLQQGKAHAGDILILARKRSVAFEAVIKALKDANVPVTGTDKLILTYHIAVMDLIAAGKAALNLNDDLTLATVLTSPLLGFDQEELFTIAAHRVEGVSLIEALKQAALHNAKAQNAQLTLETWAKRAVTHGPFSFYSPLLSVERGRHALLSRLGQEASDVINTFLAQALAHEQRQTPSLMQFLQELESAELVVKRDMESFSNEVRVMTVHGAKGLEAPLVILMEDGNTHKPASQNSANLLKYHHENKIIPLFAPSLKHDPLCLAHSREATLTLMREEHNRLLYVAMTRARDHLIIAPFMGGRSKEPPVESWYEMIRAGITSERAAACGVSFEHTGEDSPLLWQQGIRKASSTHAVISKTPTPPPPWLFEPVVEAHMPHHTLRPSQSQEEDAVYAPHAQRIGVLVHTLLQHLPSVQREQRMEAAHAYLASLSPTLSKEDTAKIMAQTFDVLNNPRLANVFSATSQAEVAVTGVIEGRAVSGQMDRLAITEESVVIVDYKTSLRAPQKEADIPLSHRMQIQAYATLMKQLYPQKTIHSWLIYTMTGQVFEV